MKALVDLNVVLDVILNRQPFFADSSAVWNSHQSGEFDGYLAATEITNLYYVVRKLSGESTARSAVDVCLNAFAIVPVDEQILLAAQSLTGKDFEDNVCIACAMTISADWIVTRDVLGFSQSAVTAILPADFIQQLRSQRKPLP